MTRRRASAPPSRECTTAPLRAQRTAIAPPPPRRAQRTHAPHVASYAFCVPIPALERHVLTAPDVIARAAARYAAGIEQAWMLRQPCELRRSFAEQAFGRGEAAEQIWMLRQADDVRAAYVREVLGG